MTKMERYLKLGQRRARLAEREKQALTDALAVIEHGKPFVSYWSDEGTPESGPSGGAVYGYRWGQMKVERTRPGDVAIIRDRRDGHGYPGRWEWIHFGSGTSKTYSGVGAMISDHLRAVERNAERNGIEFVRTGKRPTDPSDPYYLDNILAHEEAARA